MSGELVGDVVEAPRPARRRRQAGAVRRRVAWAAHAVAITPIPALPSSTRRRSRRSARRGTPSSTRSRTSRSRRSATAQGNRNATSRSKMMNRIDDQVEAHVELHARVVEGVEAAFIGRQLLGVRASGGRRAGDAYRRQGDGDRDPEEDQDRQVFGAAARPCVIPLTRRRPCRTAPCLRRAERRLSPGPDCRPGTRRRKANPCDSAIPGLWHWRRRPRRRVRRCVARRGSAVRDVVRESWRMAASDGTRTRGLRRDRPAL